MSQRRCNWCNVAIETGKDWLAVRQHKVTIFSPGSRNETDEWSVPRDELYFCTKNHMHNYLFGV